MKFIQGKDRSQTEFFCLDQAVSDDNEVRLIDLFIGACRLSDYGFKMAFVENGRPAYHPSDLLKLFIYGYLNRIRSSRHLEKECKRNIELMWLMRGLTPMFLILIGYFKLIRRMFGIDFSEGEFSKWRDLASLNGLYLGKKQYGFEPKVAF